MYILSNDMLKDTGLQPNIAASLQGLKQG